MKVMTIVGARPEFIQCAPASNAIRAEHTELLVHTGQHYDANMSDVFFKELNLPTPDFNLGIGSGSHAQQTGQMMIGLETLMIEHRPDWVLVYGDTNSTVAAALSAVKLHIPVAHIEAGLRSYDRAMPEEINRIVTDHVSTLLFAPTQRAVDNLKSEGITAGVFSVGDVRVDVLPPVVEYIQKTQREPVAGLRLADFKPFVIATIHRAENTDKPERLRGIVETLNALDMPVFLPVHPRLRKMMATFGLQFEQNVHTLEPVGFIDMLALLEGSSVVVTDSGGLQKEAYLRYRPTVTVRDSTEWIETVTSGWNRLCPPTNELKDAVNVARTQIPEFHPDYYGSAGVGERICKILEQEFSR